MKPEDEEFVKSLCDAKADETKSPDIKPKPKPIDVSTVELDNDVKINQRPSYK